MEENLGMVNETRANSMHVNFKIGHLNIWSLKNREHSILIRELVMENDFDIFTISETWLNKTVTDVEVEFPGYTIQRLDREKKLGGGVAYFDSVDGRTPPRWSSTSLSRSQTALAHLDEFFDGFQQARC